MAPVHTNVYPPPNAQRRLQYTIRVHVQAARRLRHIAPLPVGGTQGSAAEADANLRRGKRRRLAHHLA
eukprot:7043225-Prymnesium_polylepis.1